MLSSLYIYTYVILCFILIKKVIVAWTYANEIGSRGLGIGKMRLDQVTY